MSQYYPSVIIINIIFGVLLDQSALSIRQVGPARLRSSQETNINREAPPFICTHFTQASLQEREEEVRQEEERSSCFGFYTALVEFYTEEVLWGFLPCGFPEENICVLCVIVLVVLSVILLL